jgi:hypothetical protein
MRAAQAAARKARAPTASSAAAGTRTPRSARHAAARSMGLRHGVRAAVDPHPLTPSSATQTTPPNQRVSRRWRQCALSEGGPSRSAKEVNARTRYGRPLKRNSSPQRGIAPSPGTPRRPCACCGGVSVRSPTAAGTSPHGPSACCGRSFGSPVALELRADSYLSRRSWTNRYRSVDGPFRRRPGAGPMVRRVPGVAHWPLFAPVVGSGFWGDGSAWSRQRPGPEPFGSRARKGRLLCVLEALLLRVAVASPGPRG